MKILSDVAHQWDLELRNLESQQPNGIRPTKSIASLSFWIKKLKPIRAFYVPKSKESQDSVPSTSCPVCGTPSANGRSGGEDIESQLRAAMNSFGLEIHDINERISITLAIEQLVDYATGEDYLLHRTVISEEGIHFNRGDIVRFLEKYFHQRLGKGSATIYDNMIFNMRYRTFATHHLVHILDQILFSITHMNDEKKETHKKERSRKLRIALSGVT